jgi:hypothetical protein
MENMANFKQPTTGLRSLKVALANLEMLLPERGSEMTGFRQQRITDLNPIRIIRIGTRKR